MTAQSYMIFKSSIKMNKLELQTTQMSLTRPVGALSPNKLSRIPRWCKNKIPQIHSSPCTERVYLGKPRGTFTNDELLGVCEPPFLKVNELKKVWKAKEQRKQVDEKLWETTAHAEFLKEILKEVKVIIETISARLENSNNSPYNNDEGEGCNYQDILADMANEKMILQRDLLENLDLEEKLTEELQNAQYQLSEARVAEQLFALEIEKKVDPLIQHYDKRNVFMTQKRNLREKIIKENAEISRTRRMKMAAESLKKAANAPTKKELTMAKVKGIKTVRKKMETYIKKTMNAIKQKKFLEACDKQMIQDYQLKNLTNLKTEIDDQRDNLKLKIDAKRKRDAGIVKEKERIHTEFVKHGKNPYYIDHLLAIEEKRTEQQRKILVKEQERLYQLQRECELEEKAKKQEKIKKRKWETFWSKRLKERKKAMLQKNREFLNSVVTVASTTNENYSDYEEPEPPSPSIVSTAKSTKKHVTQPEDQPRKKSAAQESSRAASIHEDNEEAKSKGSLKIELAESVKSIPEKRRSTRSSSIKGSSKGSLGSNSNKERSLNEIPRMSLSTSGKIRSSGEKLLVFGDEWGEDFEDFSSGTGTLDNESSIISEEYDGESDYYEPYDPANLNKAKKSLEVPAEGASAFTTGFVERLSIKPTINKKSFGDGDAQGLKIKNPKDRFFKAKPKYLTDRPTFKWDPKVVVFNNYDLGISYKQTLAITNISTERVSFVLKEFIDVSIPSLPSTSTAILEKSSHHKPVKPSPSVTVPITDVIKIKCPVSKPISPGLSHNVLLKFTPHTLQNWKGVLKFESNMKPFEVMVECFRKRVVPVLTPENVAFTNIVANTTGMATVKLKNTGAKSIFIARLVQHSPPINVLLHVDTPSEEKDYHHGLHGSKIRLNGHHELHSDSSLKTHRLSHDNSSRNIHHGSHHDERTSTSGRKKAHHGSGSGKQIVTDILHELVNSVDDDIFIAYVKDCKRDFRAGATLNICILFRPPYVDIFKTTFDIEFDDHETDKVSFHVVGTPIENPISLEPINTDFRICTMDHNYQQIVSVTTRARGAGKVTPEVPKELRPFVEVHPKHVTVFPGSDGKFSVKLHPKPIMMKKGNPALQFIDTESNIIDFPVKFHLHFPFKVNSPLTATFMAVLNIHSIEISPTEIDLGKCSSIETVAANFFVINNSILPQRIGFVGLPNCITIQPNFGFATLLPKETRQFQLLFSLPHNAIGEFDYHLKCQSLEKRDAWLHVKSVAKNNHVLLSQSCIYFPATAVGSVSNASIDIYSSSHIRPDSSVSKPKFEFSIDPEFPIKIIPQGGYIPFGQTKRVAIRFDAQLSEKDVKAHLIAMLARDYLEMQATKQRELDGINQTLKFDMVFGEEDFDEEFLNKLAPLNNKSSLVLENEGPESARKSMTQKKRNSFIQQAVPESNIRLSINSQGSSSANKLLNKNLTPDQNITKNRSRASRNSSASINQLQVEETKRLSDSSGSANKIRSSKKLSLTNPKLSSGTAENEGNKTSSDPRLAFMMQNYKALEQRRDELVKQLEIPFDLEAIKNVEIDTNSREYHKAKRDLMKHLTVVKRTYTIPCFVTDEHGEVDMILLDLKCLMSSPSLILLEDSNVINFGIIPVGAKAYKEVRLYNPSSSLLKIKMDIINPYGPFLQCNALRKIPSDCVYSLKLRFSPQDSQTFEETVKINGRDSLIALTLVGTGAVPQFTLTPTKNDLYVGTISVGSFGYQQFEITNSGEAELEFRVELVNQGHYEGNLAIPRGPSYNDVLNESDGLKVSNLLPSSRTGVNIPPPSAVKYDSASAYGQGNSAATILQSAKSVKDGRDELQEDIDISATEIQNNSEISSPKSLKSRKSTTINKRKSTLITQESDGRQPVVNPLFELKNEDKSITKLTTMELIAQLDKNKEQYFFQSLPSPPIHVYSNSSTKFNVFFVPVTSGRFFAEYQVRLYDSIIHRFSIIGVGLNLDTNSGEDDEM